MCTNESKHIHVWKVSCFLDTVGFLLDIKSVCMFCQIFHVMLLHSPLVSRSQITMNSALQEGEVEGSLASVASMGTVGSLNSDISNVAPIVLWNDRAMSLPGVGDDRPESTLRGRRELARQQVGRAQCEATAQRPHVPNIRFLPHTA